MADKKSVSWIEFVKIKKGENKGMHLKEVLKMAGDEWKKIKAGTHEKYTQGKSAPRTRKKSKGCKKGKKTKGSNPEDEHESHGTTRKSNKSGKCNCCAKLRKEIKRLKARISELE